MTNQCDKHMDYQLTNELNNVNSLINDIECKYNCLNAAIAIVKGYKGPTEDE